MARVLAAEAAREVDVLPTVDVPDAGTLCALDNEGRRGHPGRDILLARSQDAVGRTSLSERHSPSLYGRDGPFLGRNGRKGAVMLAAVSASSLAISVSLVAGLLLLAGGALLVLKR